MYQRYVVAAERVGEYVVPEVFDTNPGGLLVPK